ncbi:unnamed protein product, partial [Rotaria socialis]
MILDYSSTLTYCPTNKREAAKKHNDVITIPNRDH